MFKRGLGFLSVAHFVNDFLVGVVSAILPLLIVQFHLSYLQGGALIMTSNVAAQLLQPVFGYVSDKKGSPWVLPFGAVALGGGLALIPFAPSFIWLLPAVALSGIGSAAFHPDASRAVFFTSGGKRGLAQSFFQIGGNSGLALSPLALFFLDTVGLKGALWFLFPAALSTVLMATLIPWFSVQLRAYGKKRAQARDLGADGQSQKGGLTLLLAIVSIRSLVVIGISTFIPLLMVHNFGVSLRWVWVYTFVFLLLGAVGTLVGGPFGDRLGKRRLIRISVAASVPFAIALPYLPRSLMIVDLALLGFFLLSTFAVTIVYGQEMLPKNIAMVSGLIIGLANGIAGFAVMLLGYVADRAGLSVALQIVVWLLPLAALGTIKLPLDRQGRLAREKGQGTKNVPVAE